MALERIRGRMPVWAFVLLAVVCLALLGVACACFDDQFAQAFDRALQAPVAVMDAWTAIPAASTAALLLVLLVLSASRRASPAMLQRFLF